MSAFGTVDDALARVIDDVVERRLRPLVAELAELRATLQARGSTNAPMEYLTSTEAARLLKLSPQTLNRWVKTGKLEAEGPSRARRFRDLDLAEIEYVEAPAVLVRLLQGIFVERRHHPSRTVPGYLRRARR